MLRQVLLKIKILYTIVTFVHLDTRQISLEIIMVLFVMLQMADGLMVYQWMVLENHSKTSFIKFMFLI